MAELGNEATVHVQQEQRPLARVQGNGPANTGIVYILSNLAMPNYIKVGVTSGDSPEDVQKRMRELANATGVPRAFDCEYATVVNNYDKVEEAILYAFASFRVNPRREFLEGIDPVRVKAILKLHEIKEVTPGADGQEENEALEKERPPRKKREGFEFSMVGIPVGASLQWADDPEIQCEVADEKTSVLYEGETLKVGNVLPQALHIGCMIGKHCKNGGSDSKRGRTTMMSNYPCTRVIISSHLAL